MDASEGPGNGFSQQCGSCDSPSFSCWCLDCHEALCEDCVSAHRRVSVTRSHRLLNQPPAERSANPPTKFCRLHPSEPLKLFCFTCSQLTCRDCQLTTHMNHRYEFVSEALDGLKKQLQDQVEPIRAQRDTVRRSLQDMHIRLRDIVQHESCLKLQLHQSYDVFLQHLKKRKEDLIQDIQKVHESELDWIHRRMTKLRELQESLQSVTDAADKAKNTTDLMSLQTYRAQIESQLKDLPDQDLSPPQMIPQMKVVTDSNSLFTVLNFGRLDVSWVPFSVSSASAQDPGPPGTSSCSVLPPTTSLQSTCSLQTGTTTCSSPAPVHSTAASSAGHQCPPPYSSTCPPVLPPSSASRTLSQSAVTVNSSSGSPANLNSTSGQLWLLPSSSFVTGLSSAAPPTFTSTCPDPQTTGLNATVEQRRDKHVASLQKSLNDKLLPPRSFHSSVPLLTVTSPGYSCKALCQTGTTSVSFSSSSCSISSPWIPNYAAVSSSFVKPPQPLSSLTMNTKPRQVQVKCTKPMSTFPLVLQPDQSSSHDALRSVPVGLYQSPSPGQNRPAVVLLYRPSVAPPVPEPPSPGHTATPQTAASSPVIIPSVTAERVSVGLSPTAQVNTTVTGKSSAVPSGPVSSLQPVPSDVTPDSSSLGHQDLSHVVKAVADSACDHSTQQVEVRQQEPAENEPTSTVCEETQPVAWVRDTTDTDSEEATEQQDSALSLRQPKVSLFRLPVPATRPGRPLPAYRVVRGDAKGEIYLEEMSDDCESHADDESEPPSPESPVTLQVVSCSACGSANGSIICFSCGRGYHRECHLPPVGPAFWSEWVCSLCQDLTDSSDPYSSERPPTTRSLCLSLLNQRRCESLLLYLKVEGCSLLPQSHLKMMSERLSLRRAAYTTAAEFLSDSWSLFEQASSSQLLEDDPLNKLQRSFHTRAVKMFGADLPPSLLTPPNSSSHQQRPNKDAGAESRLKETRKRLGQFLVLMGTSAAKRTKKDTTQ